MDCGSTNPHLSRYIITSFYQLFESIVRLCEKMSDCVDETPDYVENQTFFEEYIQM